MNDFEQLWTLKWQVEIFRTRKWSFNIITNITCLTIYCEQMMKNISFMLTIVEV